MRKKALFTAIILMVCIQNTIISQHIEKKNSQQFNYLIYLPDSYNKDAAVNWPLILFLHGGGERGSNLNKVKNVGPLRFVKDGEKLQFIIVSPQIERGMYWGPDSLRDFLADITREYKVDKKRIYLTGLSIGGKGTWETAMKYPELFAAIAPVSGWAKPDMLSKLRDTPVWVFHGAKDPVVPVIASVVLADSLKKYNNVKLTIYPEGMHNHWEETYSNKNLYKWFLDHKK
jgi:predicted peptidase